MLNDTHGLKIMIVGLDDSIEPLLTKAFTGHPIQLFRIHSGIAALEDIRTIAPDLILSGYDTRDIDGSTLFKRLFQDASFSKYQDIPFILFSSLDKRDLHGPELFKCNLRGWLCPPFSADVLRELLYNILWTQEGVKGNIELQQEIKRSQYRYRDLLENANDFIFTLDEKGCFVYLNNRFTPLTGWQKEDWIGQPFLTLIGHSDRENALHHYQIAHQGKARIFEATIMSNASNSPILSFNITPIFEKGTIVGSIGIARDVTEQKKMQREILNLKNFNESIIRSMEAGLLTIDLSGKITSLNKGGEKILEWKARQIIGKPIHDVLKEEEVKVLLSRPPLPDSPSYSRETELTVKSGKKVSIGFTTTHRMDTDNKKVGTIISFRDITLLKQMQREVFRMDRLASLGVLASGIAHEIKNPLAGIKTMAQACEEEFSEEDPRKEYLTRIVRQVNRLDELLKTFFAYAKPKPPDRKHHQLPEVMQEVLNLVSKKMTSTGIQYTENYEPDLPLVLIDSQQIQQVFLNLILNAIDAMSKGDRLTIQVKRAQNPQSGLIGRARKKRRESNGSCLEVIISDTGKGIDEKDLEIIFDPFFTTKPNGLGLGLSIVYRILEEHQGDIIVNSCVGKGTSFTITLPTGVS